MTVGRSTGAVGSIPVRAAILVADIMPGDFGDRIERVVTGIGHFRIRQMAVAAEAGIGNRATYQMFRVSPNRECRSQSLTTKSFRGRAGLIVGSAVTTNAQIRAGPVALPAERRVAGKGINSAVDMKIPADDFQSGIDDIGVAVGALQSKRCDMQIMFPQEVCRVGSGIVTRAARSLTTPACPTGAVRQVASREIAVTVGRIAGS